MDIESIPSGLSDTSFAWKMLSSDDKNEYYRLKQAFFNSEKKNIKGFKGIIIFQGTANDTKIHITFS